MSNTGACILVVEDEVDMARVLSYNLARRGHEVVVTHCLADARNALAHATPQLILLDLRLPDGFGIDLLRELHAVDAVAPPPVIVASAMGEEESVVTALELGAEDYVVKPFRVRELMARVERVLKRHNEGKSVSEEPVLTAGPIVLDTGARTATAGGVAMELTRTEFDLVAHFIRFPNKAWTRGQLCDQVLEAAGTVQERTIDAHIRTIRRKLGACGRCIETVWGVGYKFSLDPDCA